MRNIACIVTLLLSAGYAQSINDQLDSILDDFGHMDRICLGIPTTLLKPSIPVKNRIREYNVKQFEVGKNVSLMKIPSRTERYAIVQDGELVDSRDMLLKLLHYEKFSGDIYEVYENIRKARRLLVAQCIGGPVWVGTAPLGVIVATLSFNGEMDRKKTTSLKHWKNIVDDYNEAIEQGSLGEPKKEMNRKIERYITNADSFCIKPGLAIACFPIGVDLQAEYEMYDVNQRNTYTYTYRLNIPSLSTKVMTMQIGGKYQNLFAGMRGYFFPPFEQEADIRFNSHLVDDSASKGQIRHTGYSYLAAGGHLMFSYDFNFKQKFFSLTPGLHAGFLYHEVELDEVEMSSLSSTRIEDDLDGHHIPNLRFEYSSLGGVSIGSGLQLWRLNLSFDYMLHMGIETVIDEDPLVKRQFGMIHYFNFGLGIKI